MGERIPVAIDTDPGIDDAAALAAALFSPELDVRLITTVAGNVGIEKTTRNALRLESFLGTSVPVARGASAPLEGVGLTAADVHGDTGLGDWGYDREATGLLLPESAVDALWREVLRTSESGGRLTVLTLGPLTNLALLLRAHPELPGLVDRVVCMGGAIWRGNVGVLSEFNIACDPVAAREVVESDLDVTLVPLEVADKALLSPADIARLAAANDVGAVLAEMFGTYDSHRAGESGSKEMYDPTAVGYLADPGMYQAIDVYVQIDTDACCSAGGSHFDLDGLRGRRPNVHLATSIDADSFRDWLVAAVGRCR